MKDNKTLNKKLWNIETNKLDEQVREHIIRIVKFLKDLVEENIDDSIIFRDCFLVGSMCGYNYTDESDLDLHIIVKDDKSKDLLHTLLNYIKSDFNKKYPITIRKIPIEINFELDTNITSITNGIYSIRADKWIQEPVHSDLDIEIDPKSLSDYNDEIDDVLDSDDINKVDKELSKIYHDRKHGLNTSGIFSAGNLMFRRIRNAGKIKALKDKKKELITRSLSLEETLTDVLQGNANTYYQTFYNPDIPLDAELANIESYNDKDNDEILCGFNYMVGSSDEKIGKLQTWVVSYKYDDLDKFIKDVTREGNISIDVVKEFWNQSITNDGEELLELPMPYDFNLS